MKPFVTIIAGFLAFVAPALATDEQPTLEALQPSAQERENLPGAFVWKWRHRTQSIQREFRLDLSRSIRDADGKLHSQWIPVGVSSSSAIEGEAGKFTDILLLLRPSDSKLDYYDSVGRPTDGSGASSGSIANMPVNQLQRLGTTASVPMVIDGQIILLGRTSDGKPPTKVDDLLDFISVVIKTSDENIPPLVKKSPTRPNGVPWSAAQATGLPDTLNQGDYSSAWACASPDKQTEWLQVEFLSSTLVDTVRIFESYNPGAISKVSGQNADGTWTQLAAIPNRDAGPAEFKPAAGVDLETRVIRIEIDEPRIPGWNEIDAVSLLDKENVTQWASSATASSSFGDSVHGYRMEFPSARPGWSAMQATGSPDTPKSGDYTTAWASRYPDNGDEWLEVSFATASEAAACSVYQSNCPGAVQRILAYNESGTLLGALDPKSRSTEVADGGITILKWGITGFAKIKKLRLELDTKLVPGWNEIDAVQLSSPDGNFQWASNAEASSSFGDSLGNGLREPLSAGRSAGGDVPPAIPQMQLRVDKLASDFAALGDFEGAGTVARFLSLDAKAKGLPWSSEQATGMPDTAVRGDLPTAWAPKTIAGGEEWLEAVFPQSMVIEQARIFESNLLGAITSVKAIASDGSSHELEIILEETNGDKPRVLLAKCPADQSLTTRVIRILLDSRKTPDGWPEIDAIELVSKDSRRQWASEATASSSYSERYQPQTIKPAGYQRATSLEEANERLEQLSKRLESLERQFGPQSKAGGSIPDVAPAAPQQR